MQPEIAGQLLKLNHQFYQTFAEHFSATRQRLQPGVIEAVKTIPHGSSLLDLGCGNGLLAAHLAKSGHTGPYIGIDSAENLIEIARAQQVPNARFLTGNLAAPDWDTPLAGERFDYILCFATLHHLPGKALRAHFLHKVRQLLSPDGRFIFSNWQFLNSERLKERIVPWAEIGLTEAQVDENDYLMDWRRGGQGLRYVHHYTNKELHTLADETGFQVAGIYTSDGENGNLGLYHIWQYSP